MGERTYLLGFVQIMAAILKAATLDQSHIFLIEKGDVGHHIRPESSKKWIAANRCGISCGTESIDYYYCWSMRLQPSDDGDVHDILFLMLFVNVVDCNCGPNGFHHFDV